MSETVVAKRQDSTPVIVERSPLEKLLLGGLRKQLATVLGTQEKADAYVVEILNMARRVPGLHSCTQDSLAYGIMRFASLRLNPAIPNECWLIPRGGKAEPQYGYGGLRKLVLRSAEVIDCFSKEVCENDTFAYPDTPVSLPHHTMTPFVPRGRVIGYYNVIQKTNGNWLTLLMSVRELLAHRDRYAQQDRSGQYGSAWSQTHPDKEGLTSFDKMGLKTVLRMNCSPRNVTLEADVWDVMQSEQIDLRRASVPRKTVPQLPQEGTGVTLDLNTGEIRETVAVENPEHGKTVEQHISDLYGKDAPPIHPRQTPMGLRIKALLTAQGLSAAEQDARWQEWQAHYPLLTPSVLAIIHDQLAPPTSTSEREPGDEEGSLWDTEIEAETTEV